MVLRVHYNWFTIDSKGEYFFDYTCGYFYPIPGVLGETDEVESISVEGDLVQGNAVATVKFKKGYVIQQSNICTIITNDGQETD